jgi:hypothetical protein
MSRRSSLPPDRGFTRRRKARAKRGLFIIDRVARWNCLASSASRRKELPVAIAYLQEFEIRDGDTSTTNYDAVSAALDLKQAPDGLLIHTAGFDHDAGVFRIFDVWESREHGEKFLSEKLMPIIERMAGEAAQSGDESFTPPSRETWYDLHDSMSG